jgi:hypothetical protein
MALRPICNELSEVSQLTRTISYLGFSRAVRATSAQVRYHCYLTLFACGSFAPSDGSGRWEASHNARR